METLQKKVSANSTAIIHDLDLSQQFLALTTRCGLVDIADCAKLQQIRSVEERNGVFLDMMLARDDDAVYVHLIDCLQKTGQHRLANKLTDVREELTILEQMQSQLEEQLTQLSDYLATEERRAGIYLTEPPQEDDVEGNPALTEKDIWLKVQGTMKKSQQQLIRCQAVMKKLHQDCETVAKQNSDIIAFTKECDNKIKDVLSQGRKSAKQSTVPKKTQDIFANLMDDIEKLVKTRKRVITMETEGRRHSTRIVRQCRDWIEDRSLILQKLHTSPNPGGGREADPEITTSTRRPAPPLNDNAIMSILDCLQLLEQELQQYIHLEILLTDKYRSEVRRKQLQRRIHGFSAQGITEAMDVLKKLEQDPSSVKDKLDLVQSSLTEINKEYGECLFYLNRVEPRSTASPEGQNSVTAASKSPPQPSRMANNKDIRDWPSNFKRRPNMGKMARSVDYGMNAAGSSVEKQEPNQLLTKLRTLVTQYEDLKADDLSMGQKYRAEFTKKKRELDIGIQRRDDQIIRLQTQLKEVEAEKEKYKKLYNDTKIGFQRTHNNPS